MFRWNLMLRTLFGLRREQPKDRRRQATVKPHLEALEDRTLLSGSAINPLPVVSVASPPPAPSLAAVTSFVADRMNQWSNLIATVQQDVIAIWKAIGQEIAQEVSFMEQQWERLLGIDPSAQDRAANTAASPPSTNYGAGRGNSSSSGRGSGSTTSAHNTPDPASNTPTQNSGNGSGSGSGSSSGHSLSSPTAGTSPTTGIGPMAGSGGGGSGVVFVSFLSGGTVNEYTATGTLVQTYSDGFSGEHTGMAFDSSGRLYVTNFDVSNISRFTTAGTVDTPNPYASGDQNSYNESIAFDNNGDFYVGQATPQYGPPPAGSGNILKFNAAGALIARYDAITENRGSDWIALAPDQATMYYTSEGMR